MDIVDCILADHDRQRRWFAALDEARDDLESAGKIFNRLREGAWWRAPLASTLVGSSVDTAIFFTIAFSGALTFIEPGNDVSWAGEILPLLGMGPEAPLWVSLAVADWLVKLSLALVALVPFRVLTARLTAQVA